MVVTDRFHCISNTNHCVIILSVPWHDDVIKWKHSLRYWPFVRGIHRSPVSSPHKVGWRGALMFSLICAWINGWVNNREAGDLRRHRVHNDVIVMTWLELELVHLYLNPIVVSTGYSYLLIVKPLQWRHNRHYDGVSNHRRLDCLLNGLFRRGSKETSKLRVNGHCVGNSPGTGEFPAQRASNAKMFPFVDVIMPPPWNFHDSHVSIA